LYAPRIPCNIRKLIIILEHCFTFKPLQQRRKDCITLFDICYHAHSIEAWTIRRDDERRLISAEMRFLRRTAGYSRWDHK
jgi:hypothetical protein